MEAGSFGAAMCDSSVCVGLDITFKWCSALAEGYSASINGA